MAKVEYPEILLDYRIARTFGWDYEQQRRQPPQWLRDLVTVFGIEQQIRAELAATPDDEDE